MTDRQKRAAMNKRMPEIAARVFALRNRPYRGCGYHYAMEKTLGAVIRDLNDYDSPRSGASDVITAVLFEELLRDLIRAEFSARGWEFP